MISLKLFFWSFFFFFFGGGGDFDFGIYTQKKNKILKANVAYGGMSEIPKRAKAIEKALTNSTFSEDTFLKAQKLITKDFSPIDDMRASKKYRVDVAKNLIMKFFHEVSSRKNLRVIS